MSPIERARAKSDALRALGLSGQAKPGEIRAAWKRLAFETHPDRNGGSLDAFAEARAAYDLLASEANRTNTKAASPTPAADEMRVAVSRRPSVAGKVIQFSEDVLARCRGMLEEKIAADVARSDGSRSCTTDHVARSVHCRGRCLSYTVDTRLGDGINRVALPSNILADPKRAKPQIVTFRSEGSGSGDVEIPEALRARLFSGARNVRIRFAKD
jgi:hypothetical protein